MYNGQQSVLWKNLREMFPDELRAMYQQLRSTGAISYDKVERMFEEHQEKWPEAIFNEDAWFKYLAPLEEKNSAAYLSMLQGSKAEQRKWWLYNRFRYLDSKYNAGDSLTDVITLRGYAKSNITITPYADIYATVKYGSYLVQQRAERKQSYELICPLDNVNDTEIYIYSASQLADVGDLSGLKVGYAEFVYATKLQHLKLGDEAALYQNNNLQTLYLGQNTLLKTLDVRNCYALGTGDQKSVDLSGCTNIEEVYFDGTQIRGVSLPNGGILKKLHLPGTITNLTLRNQTALTEFICDGYSNITTLWVDRSLTYNRIYTIVNSMPSNGRVRLFNFDWSVYNLNGVWNMFNKLKDMTGLDENGNNTEKAQVYGTIYATYAGASQIADIQTWFPDVTITYGTATAVLNYYNYDGSELLYSESVIPGNNGTWTGTPEREPDVQYTYRFEGWNTEPNRLAQELNARTNITVDRDVYAAYSRTINAYTVYWVLGEIDGGTIIETDINQLYGSTPTFNSATPTSSRGSAFEFMRWTPEIGPVTGDTTYTAVFDKTWEVLEIQDSWDEIIARVNAGTAADYYYPGNYKAIDLGSEGVIEMQIVGKNKDQISTAPYGTAQLTWIARQVLNTKRIFNPVLQEVYTWQDYPLFIPKFYTSKTEAEYRTTHSTTTEHYDPQDVTATFTVTSTETTDMTIVFGYTYYSQSYSGNRTSWLTVDGTVLVEDYHGRTHNQRSQSFTIPMTADVPVTVQYRYKSTGNVNSKPITFTSSSSVPAFAFPDGTVYSETGKANKGYPTQGTNNTDYIRFVVSGTAQLNISMETGKVPALVHTSYKDGTGSIGGYFSSDLRTYVNETIVPLIPENIREAMKIVTKYTYENSSTYTPIGGIWRWTSRSYNMRVWIPCMKEVGLFNGSNQTTYETQSPVYARAFGSQNARIRTDPNGTQTSYWLRSSSTTNRSYINVIGTGGNNGEATSNIAYGVLIGFCT